MPEKKGLGGFLAVTDCTEKDSSSCVTVHSGGNWMGLGNKGNFLPLGYPSTQDGATPIWDFSAPSQLYFPVWFRAPHDFTLPTSRLHLQPHQGDPSSNRGNSCSISPVPPLRTFLMDTSPSPSTNPAAGISTRGIECGITHTRSCQPLASMQLQTSSSHPFLSVGAQTQQHSPA